jgi:hypothetical protein
MDADLKARSILAGVHGRHRPRAATWPGVTLPGAEPLRFYVRVPSNEDGLAARAFAEAEFGKRGMKPNLGNAEAFEEEVVNQLLARVCLQADDAGAPTEQPLALDADDMRAHTTAHDRAKIFAMLRDLVEETDPDLDELPAEVIAAIEDALKKKQGELLRGFGSNVLASFMRTSVVLRETSTT